MATNPGYAAIPNNGPVITNSTASAVLFTAGANGSRIESIVANAVSATTNTIGSIYLVKGGTSYLYHTFNIPASTLSTTTPNWGTTIYSGTAEGRFPLSLASGETIAVTTGGTHTIHWVAVGADL